MRPTEHGSTRVLDQGMRIVIGSFASRELEHPESRDRKALVCRRGRLIYPAGYPHAVMSIEMG